MWTYSQYCFEQVFSIQIITSFNIYLEETHILKSTSMTFYRHVFFIILISPINPQTTLWGLCRPRKILTRAQVVNIVPGLGYLSCHILFLNGMSDSFVFGVRMDLDGG